jgi:hypothetical protein
VVLGSELVTNGDFASGTGWDTDGSITGGQLLCTGGTYALNDVAENGNATFRLVFTIVSISSGSVQGSLFDAAATGTSRSTAGTFTEDIPVSGVGAGLILVLTSTDAIVDNVSLKQVL